MGRRQSSYVGPRAIRVLSTLLVLAAAVDLVVGVAFAINGVTQAGSAVTVPVDLVPGLRGGDLRSGLTR